MLEAKESLTGEINAKYIIEGNLNVGIERVYPTLEDITITPTAEKQVFNHENSYGYDEVTVEAVETENLEVIPSAETQVNEGLYNKVTVAGDSDLVPENIKEGANIFGVEGSAKTTNAKITSGYYLFYQNNRVDYVQELLNLCESLTDMNSMFYGCSKLTKLDLSNLDTSNVTDMGSMFSNCSKLTSLDVSNFDTSNVIYMSSMFNNCSELTSLDVSNFDTSNVTNMSSMFSNCPKLTSLDVSNFDTSNVTDMSNMFKYCSELTSLDVSNFDTSNVTNMKYLFSNCYNLAKLDIRNFTFDKVTNYSDIFLMVPTDCLIIVKSDTEKEWVLARRSDFTNVKILDEFHIKSIEVNANNINVYGENKTGKVIITYNGGDNNLLFPEEEGYTLSISGNATIDENGIITLNDNAQVGDKLIITAVSTYDSSITATKEIEVVYKEPYYEVVLNDGQWVDSGETIDGNVVYKSDAGSYNVNDGKSIATIKTFGLTNLKLYIRSYAESSYDYTEAFAVDTEAVREKGLYTTKGKQSATNYIECIYELDGGEHTIQVMYSKDRGGNTHDDRGYFYVGEYS